MSYDNGEKISKGSKLYYLAIIALFLGSLTTFGVEYCVQPIIPVFSESFGLSPATASLAVAFGTGGMSGSMLLIAMLASNWPRRRTMAAGLMIASLLAIAIGVSPAFNMILACRLLQGMLLAVFPAMAIAYINEEFSSEIIGTVVGIYISGTSIGGLVGRLVLSALTDYYNWRFALEIMGVSYAIICVLFYFMLPRERNGAAVNSPLLRHHLSAKMKLMKSAREIGNILHNKNLWGVFIIGMCVMGSFVCCYNFVSYMLMSEPYNLSQSAIGFVYCLYLVGTFSSTAMGVFADKRGNGLAVCLCVALMIVGMWVSAFESLALTLLGLAMFTFGFFGAHSSACSWAGRLDKANKAQISSLYMFLYYMGGSTFGSIGGIFLSSNGWNGIVEFLTAVLCVAMVAALLVKRNEMKINLKMGEN